MTKDDQKFNWTKKKLNIAKEISTGIKSQRQIAEELDVHESTISKLKQHPDFMTKVNEFTLAHELATKGGILRELMNGVHMKRKKIEDDRSTALDFLKEINEMLGYKKQHVEHSGIDTININIKRASDKDNDK